MDSFPKPNDSSDLDHTECAWCRAPFKSSKSGPHPKKYCSDKCRNEFHVALRIRGQRELERGSATMAELRDLYRRARRN